MRRTLLPLLFACGCRTTSAPLPPPASAASPSHARPAPCAQHAGVHAGDHHHGMQRDFGDVAAYARTFDDPERDAWQKPADVVALLAIAAGATVADLGAGTGYFLAPLASAVGPSGHVLALDAEPNMVAYLQQRIARHELANAEARLVQPGDPGLAPASVDRILVVNTWHHLSERVAYAAKLKAALRPGGFVAVVDFTAESDIGPPLEHRLSAAQVADELAQAGLKASLADETLPKQYVVLGRAP